MVHNHYKVVIVGAGSGGISIVARLLRLEPELRDHIVIIDPALKHYYQPLWTLVGAGVTEKEATEKDMSTVIPKGADWLRETVEAFDPEENTVSTNSGKKIGYEFLVVAAGIEINWDGVKGLKETLGKKGVCSNYSFEHVNYTWELIRNFKGGNAIFTHPATPVKCGGAPQKIMYLAEDYLNRSGIRNESEVIFGTANPAIFDVDKYRAALEEVVKKRNIKVNYRRNLIEIRPDQREAVFKNLDTGQDESIRYELLHVTPPMQAPAFIRKSKLADEKGWVDVDKYTLQHNRYKNIFALGDNSSLPTSKTGAAIRKQAPLAARNLISVMQGKLPDLNYDGYTSCPLVTGYNKLILAEFDYDKNPIETMPFNQAKERYSMYLLKKNFLPLMYWHGMLKGKM
ncbi:FAD/NAD(P)-binding oxidoreductase [Fictibacillus fluitans]|uniref:FAD/NAD(P)-binding oxidoreductase n=1 Tax=Fictibacillus fluitans TaxID=3058422 RepID=A0ABT8HRD2_9BACL|nr:FAD/NAD(P)-binding oxidoreductase [Fictibacillus sp. NE201]MDN4523334.1 FAD/NAD(P)-binding oxidoreductase [Fictibacillus sp. NE201]